MAIKGWRELLYQNLHCKIYIYIMPCTPFIFGPAISPPIVHWVANLVRARLTLLPMDFY